VWAFVRNSGTSRVVASLEIGGNGSTPRPKSRRREYSDAMHWGGLWRSSDEGAVMAPEQRPQANGLLWTSQFSNGDEPTQSSCEQEAG